MEHYTEIRINKLQITHNTAELHRHYIEWKNKNTKENISVINYVSQGQAKCIEWAGTWGVLVGRGNISVWVVVWTHTYGTFTELYVSYLCTSLNVVPSFQNNFFKVMKQEKKIKERKGREKSKTFQSFLPKEFSLGHFQSKCWSQSG